MKKAFLVALILAVCVSPSVFAQQSREDKLEEIERQIANYTRQRNTGIGITIGGVVLDLAGAVIFMNSFDYDAPGYDESTATLGYVFMSAGSAGLIVGIVVWVISAKGLREWEYKKIDVALDVQGPDLVSRETLGEIAVVVSCKF